MPNIEIKAHLRDLEKAKNTAKSIKTEYLGLDHQVDTYFKSQQGRIKFRESSLSGGMLIPYLRASTQGPKKSDYVLLQTDQPLLAKKLLSETLGVDTVVEKSRDIYLVDNVRVHLDQVKGQGTFIEFEAVYEDESRENIEREKVNRLIKVFEIAPEDLITGSYRENQSR